MEELIGTIFESHTNKVEIQDIMKCDIICLYCSAHWCPPCRTFTPVLGQVYEKINASKKQMEIVYVTFDRDEDEFNEYFQTMPFLAIPWADEERRDKIDERFEIEGIPLLIVMDRFTNVLVADARNDVTRYGAECITKCRQILETLAKQEEEAPEAPDAPAESGDADKDHKDEEKKVEETDKDKDKE